MTREVLLLVDALARDFAARSAAALGRSAMIALGLTAGLVVLLWVLSRGVRPIERRVSFPWGLSVIAIAERRGG